jgi:hypothetical protein
MQRPIVHPRADRVGSRRGPILRRMALSLLAALALSGGGALAQSAGHREHSTTPTLGQALKPSTADQLALCEHLRRVGAIYYGSWECPACFMQKNLFGQQAGDRLPYVECTKTESDRERCRSAGILAYPTWELNGRRVEGVQTLDELRAWSGFGENRGGTTPAVQGAAPQTPNQAAGSMP